MLRRPPRSTRTDNLVPYTTLFRSQANIKVVEITALLVRDDDRFADAVKKRGFGAAQKALAGLDCVAGLPLVFGQNLDAHDGSCRVVGHGRIPSRRRASRCRHCLMSSMIRWPQIGRAHV